MSARRPTGGRRSRAAFSLVLAALLWVAAAPVPRPAPELTLLDSAGRPTPLASFKGKVVVVEFLLTRCPHCWRLAQTLGKLGRELGPRGFEPVGVAFDTDISGPRLAQFAALSRVTFTVGSATAESVDRFLGRAGNERFQVPQLVVVDRAGVIRAQSSPVGEANLEDEAFLRRLLGTLLEAAPPAAR